ncbi:MAG: efflux transporter outer membrane subunit [Proteobacteria bacterium]|nr:efflux transporter outer membrane subunit [Pseudomonadota bacterium]
MRNLSLASVLALSLGASACATVGPDFERPKAPDTPGYLMKGDKAGPNSPRIVSAEPPAGAWWTAFGSPELDATIRQALADSPTLDEADATLAQSREALAVARGAEKPQVDANAGVQRERVNVAAFGFTGFPNPTITLYSIGAGVTYDLDLFGGQKRAVENAAARLEAQGRRADAAYLMLTGNVAIEAGQIAALRAQIAAVQQMIADDRQNVALHDKAVRLGGAAVSQGIGAQAQLAEDQALLPPLNQQLAQHRHALALLVGKAPADFTAPDFDLARLTLPGEVPVSLPSDLVRRRPDILAAEADLHASTAQIGVETAKLYPNVKLTAALTQGALKPQDIFSYDFSGWNFGPQVSVPLFHGGALKANRAAAAAAAEASYARYKQTVLKAFVEVADAMQALAHDEDMLQAQSRALQVAEADLRDNRVAYDKGGGTLLGVLDAQRRTHSARRNLTNAQAQRYLDTVRLYIATAADWRAEGTRAAASSRP